MENWSAVPFPSVPTVSPLVDMCRTACGQNLHVNVTLCHVCSVPLNVKGQIKSGVCVSVCVFTIMKTWYSVFTVIVCRLSSAAAVSCSSVQQWMWAYLSLPLIIIYYIKNYKRNNYTGIYTREADTGSTNGLHGLTDGWWVGGRRGGRWVDER